MILRRITDAFHKQDWFTVFIETLIVVFGVFIGLQVNNWNEARRDRIEAETSRERLIADLRADLDAFAIRRQWYEEVLEAALRVDDALRSGPAETVDEAWRLSATAGSPAANGHSRPRRKYTKNFRTLAI
jgi:hypothetical protein